MIRPRNLAIAPIVSIGAVTSILVAAAFSFRGASEPIIIEAQVEPAPNVLAQLTTSDVLTLEMFPDHYEGHFLWDGQQYEDHQWVGLDVAEKSVVGELIVATGRGTYSDLSGDSDFTFRIEANPETGEWTMWESEPEVAVNFVTEGRHEASFIDNVDNISARWVGDNGQHGRLVLRAIGASVRDSGVAANAITSGPPNAIFLDGGVLMQKRFEGDSTDCVTSDSDRVTVHYSGWNEEGQFENSWDRGRPATFKTTQVIPGWRTALRAMCAGDFARVSIPADQAYGNSRKGVPGDLIFDIEIIRIDR